MNTDIFSQALGEIHEKYIEEAVCYAVTAEGNQALRKKKRRRWMKWVVAAACLCLCMVGSVKVLLRFDYFRMGCSAQIGTIVDGAYYYKVSHDGVYRYTQEEGNVKLLSTFWEDGWLVNEYGLYFDRGRSLYVKEHETGKVRRLYRAGFFESSHIGFTLQEDGNIIVTIYNKYKEIRYELLLDGTTGEVLETVMEPIAYDDIVIPYSSAHYQVGEREIELVPAEDEYRFDLQENGESILPEGILVSRWPQYYGDTLWFECAQYEESDYWAEYIEEMKEKGSSAKKQFIGEFYIKFVVRPDGEDRLVMAPKMFFDDSPADYLFYVVKNRQIWCMDAATTEAWMVYEGEENSMYSVATDGEYLYSCVPWDEYQALWQVVRDEEGRPESLVLLYENITE